MTKQDFCECMSLIKEQYERCDKLNDGIYELFGGGDKLWGTLNVNTEVAILTKAMEDTEEWIDYFVYDCKWGEVDNDIRINGEPVAFKTFENLYELIVDRKDKE